jgi:ligand-binding SRPBCC domain-containing protein
MVDGPFKYLKHRHSFEETDGTTIMSDIFEFQSPLGILGRIVDTIFLKRYMSRFLVQRNRVIKKAAERE